MQLVLVNYRIFSIAIEVLCNTIKFFQRLHSEPTTCNLLADALNESCRLYENKKKALDVYHLFCI